MKKVAIYPGTFDPITNGHLDIGERAAGLFDEVIFAVAVENYKETLFSLSERIQLIQTATAHLPNVFVEGFDGLLVDYCQQKGATIIVRGLRAISDFEREFQMALMNKEVLPEIETVFFMTTAQYQYVSSSIIKSFAFYGSPLSSLVPPNVEIALKQKYGVVK